MNLSMGVEMTDEDFAKIFQKFLDSATLNLLAIPNTANDHCIDITVSLNFNYGYSSYPMPSGMISATETINLSDKLCTDCSMSFTDKPFCSEECRKSHHVKETLKNLGKQ